MKYRIWLIVTSSFWIAIWAADLASVMRVKAEGALLDVAHIGILMIGLLAEMLSWRSARFINVGYFLVVASWTIVRAFALELRSLTTASDAATSIALFALPMLAQGILNLVIYRNRARQTASG
ncbi:MAG TPA: hypothetical protein VHP99_19845 [Pyrinomonadaceae bacterium]|jgi:hypothetical protein|nr:hypothetical protein [Pyrinomonadaceae bacterium]